MSGGTMFVSSFSSKLIWWFEMKYTGNLTSLVGFYQSLNNCLFARNVYMLTHWGRVTHICVSKLAIICSDNDLSPGRRQAIIGTNAGILLTGQLGTNFSENVIEIYTFSFKKIHLKMSSGRWLPFCLGLNVLTSHPSKSFSHCRHVSPNFRAAIHAVTILGSVNDSGWIKTHNDTCACNWLKTAATVSFNHVSYGILVPFCWFDWAGNSNHPQFVSCLGPNCS